MSATDRARKLSEKRDADFSQRVVIGGSEALASPNMRALFWDIISPNLDAEGPGSKGRRAVARDLLRALLIADFDGVQMMREEHERRQPKGQEDKPETDE